jgi:alpha-methylacyl-CoA racemase
VYETADGRWVAVGAIEPQFHRALYALVGLPEPEAQMDRAEWPARKQALADVFRTRTRDEWCAAGEGTDACLSPVLEPAEVATHHHTGPRGLLTQLNGVTQAVPAPRFGRTPGEPTPPCHPGQHDLHDVLASWT